MQAHCFGLPGFRVKGSGLRVEGLGFRVDLVATGVAVESYSRYSVPRLKVQGLPQGIMWTTQLSALSAARNIIKSETMIPSSYGVRPLRTK